MFPWQPHLGKHVYSNLEFFLFLNFVVVTFTFFDHVSILLLVLITFESFLVVILSKTPRWRIQDGGSMMAAVRTYCVHVPQGKQFLTVLYRKIPKISPPEISPLNLRHKNPCDNKRPSPPEYKPMDLVRYIL